MIKRDDINPKSIYKIGPVVCNNAKLKAGDLITYNNVKDDCYWDMIVLDVISNTHIDIYELEVSSTGAGSPMTWGFEPNRTIVRKINEVDLQ